MVLHIESEMEHLIRIGEITPFFHVSGKEYAFPTYSSPLICHFGQIKKHCSLLLPSFAKQKNGFACFIPQSTGFIPSF